MKEIERLISSIEETADYNTVLRVKAECAMLVSHLMTKRSKAVCDTIIRFVDGRATIDELNQSRVEADLYCESLPSGVVTRKQAVQKDVAYIVYAITSNINGWALVRTICDIDPNNESKILKICRS